MSGFILSTIQSAMSVPVQKCNYTEHTMRGVIQLENIFNCLVYDWMIKDEWNVR